MLLHLTAIFLADELSIFQNLKSPHAWSDHVRGSPSTWKQSDGEIIRKALLEAQENPVTRPVDKRKLARRPRALETEIGPVTVPEDEETVEVALPTSSEISEATKHSQIQHHLLKLGRDMGFEVWVARNDRNREFSGFPSDYGPRIFHHSTAT